MGSISHRCSSNNKKIIPPIVKIHLIQMVNQRTEKTSSSKKEKRERQGKRGREGGIDERFSTNTKLEGSTRECKGQPPSHSTFWKYPPPFQILTVQLFFQKLLLHKQPMCLELVNKIDHFWVGQPTFEESADWKGPGGQKGVLLPQGKMESKPEILGPCLTTHRNLRGWEGKENKQPKNQLLLCPSFGFFESQKKSSNVLQGL